MRRIYQRLARRQALLVKRAKVVITEVDNREEIVALVGFATFFFGFAAGAILNLYLLAISHPLVEQFRSALSYKSAIFGDGILLPVINMVATAFILRNREFVGKKILRLALFLGITVTAYFHVTQAIGGIVNWAMPTPWHWNILGIWHAIYMFSVASLLSLLYLISIKVMKEEKEVPMEVMVVTFGIVFFFVLLRLDYISIDLREFLPHY